MFQIIKQYIWFIAVAIQSEEVGKIAGHFLHINFVTVQLAVRKKLNLPEDRSMGLQSSEAKLAIFFILVVQTCNSYFELFGRMTVLLVSV